MQDRRCNVRALINLAPSVMTEDIYRAACLVTVLVEMATSCDWCNASLDEQCGRGAYRLEGLTEMIDDKEEQQVPISLCLDFCRRTL